MRPTPTRPRVPHAGLIALNVTLLAVLLWVTVGPLSRAESQVGAARARGQYTMVAGKTNVGGPHAIYVLDSSNQEVVALRWDSGKNSLVGIGYRNLALDGRAVPGR